MGPAVRVRIAAVLTPPPEAHLHQRRQSATSKVYNRAADTLRLCAQSLTYSKSALGAKYRRLRARLGAPKAIVAMAHDLARLVYRMLRYGQNFVEQDIH